MARPMDWEMTAIERIVYYTHRSQDTGVIPYHGGPHGEAPGASQKHLSQEAEGEGKTWGRAFIVVSTGKNRQDRLARLMTGQFEEFQWAMGQRDCPQLSVT